MELSTRNLSRQETSGYLKRVIDKVSRYFFYRILVVEDSPESQKILELAMDTVPCRVDFAKSGEEGVFFLKKNPSYDLIILDQDLPDTEGLRVLKAADSKSREESFQAYSKIPYIVYSGLELRELDEELDSFALADFIKKPTDIKTIHKRITDVLFSDRSRSL